MFKRILISALAVGAVAFGAPAAQADDPTFACDFNSVQQADATGQNFEGAGHGYIVHAADGTATIRCYIAVNGTEVSTTPTSTPTPSGVSVTAGRLTYAAGETDVVTFHAEYCTSHGCTTFDYETQVTQIPPQEVIDLIDGLLTTVFDLLIAVAETIDALLAPVFALLTQIEKDIVDPQVCPQLAAREGSYAGGLVVINSQGDVFVDGEAFWDCPPYDIFG